MKARPEPMSIPLVFVPAFMGTELERKDCYQKNNVNSNGNGNGDNLVYVNWKIGLNLSTPDLSLPLKWDCTSQGDNNDITSTSSSELSPSCLPVQAKDDIVPGGAMEQIQIDCCDCSACCSWWCCFSTCSRSHSHCSCSCPITILDQYSSFCQHYRNQNASTLPASSSSSSSSGRPFYIFAYDWRRDLNESTDNLLQFIKEIHSKHGGVRPQVVSHSMGCLITLAALHTEPTFFHSVLFVGGNFGGGAGFYPTNTEGMDVGFNKNYMSAKVCHTFPSMYAVASPMGVGNDPILKDDKKGGKQLFQFVDSESFMRCKNDNASSSPFPSIVDIDMYNLEDWKRFKLGPYSLGEAVSPEMEEHVKICLKLGKHFQNRLRYPTVGNGGNDNEEKKNGNNYGNNNDHDNNQDDSQKNSQGTILNQSDQYPPIAVLVGDQYLNPDFFLWDINASRWIEWNRQSLKRYKPNTKDFVRTDGTVSYISASQPPLPNVVKNKVKEYKARNNGPGIGSHRQLMSDVEMIDKILNDLQNSK